MSSALAKKLAPRLSTRLRAQPAEADAPKRPARKVTLLPGLVTHERAGLPIAIRVVNMSASGASLVVIASDRSAESLIEEMPERISLFLTYDRFSVAGEIKWRRGDKIGVRFISMPRIIDKPSTKMKPAAKK